MRDPALLYFFFFNDTATTEIYTLSLHDALPIFAIAPVSRVEGAVQNDLAAIRRVVIEHPRDGQLDRPVRGRQRDRKSTRLNSSHLVISYAVFCLKKKKKTNQNHYVRSQYEY